MMRIIMTKTFFILAVIISLSGCGGEVAEKYLERQVPYYEQECQNGDTRYCEVLADFYVQGIAGLPKDLNKAKFLYEKACSNLQKTACRKIDPGDTLYQFK